MLQVTLSGYYNNCEIVMCFIQPFKDQWLL